MKLTNNRYYLDLNATSPLADSVKEYLARGEFVFANPSSGHSEGKIAKRLIMDTSDYLYGLFNFSETDFKLFYHSGATEAINSIAKGFAFAHDMGNFFYFGTDHSAVRNQKEQLEKLNCLVHELPVNPDGSFDEALIIEKINGQSGPKLVNFTWVNNETGAVHLLESIFRVKEATGAIIHVDAVQSVGKIADWEKLHSGLDAYTYSGHKFGTLKNVGFTFMREGLPIQSMIKGGGQQSGLRSGTENAMGVATLMLALIELKETFNPEELLKAKSAFEAKLVDALKDKGEVVAYTNANRGLNTLNFILYDTKSQTLATALDLGGIDISTGSACASGTVTPSPVLMSMGYSEQLSKSAIRLSFHYQFNLSQVDEYWNAFSRILTRFLQF